jgi:hypothetical protein
MILKYQCKKDRSFGIFLIVSGLIIIAVAYCPLLSQTFSLTKFIIVSLIVFPVIGLFFWMWYGTYYIIDNETLTVISGPLRWRVPIHEINFIRLDQKTIGGTWKPTLSWDSIEIRYRKSKSIFITPDNQEKFLSDLKKINNEIIIKPK